MAEMVANSVQGQINGANQRAQKAEAAASSLQSQLDAAVQSNQDAELTILNLQAQLGACSQTSHTGETTVHTRETQTASARNAHSPESSPALITMTVNPVFLDAAEQSLPPGPDCASPTHTATSRAASPPLSDCKSSTHSPAVAAPSAVSASRAAEDSTEHSASDEVVPTAQVPRVITAVDVSAHENTARDEQCVSAPPCGPPSCQNAVNADSVSTSPPASSVQQTSALLSTADTSTKVPCLTASQPARPTATNVDDSTTLRNDTSPTSVLPCSSQAFSPDRTEQAAAPLPQEGTPAGCVKVTQVLRLSCMHAILMAHT